jgi:protein-S-isoprenylcysteine O-methyltransferase Ste14
MIFTSLRTAFYAVGFVLLWAWVAVAVRGFDRSLGFALPEWLRPAGMVLMVAGGALVLSCLIVFVGRGKGTPAPFDAPRVFVAVGPYRLVRNPMYIGAPASWRDGAAGSARRR